MVVQLAERLDRLRVVSAETRYLNCERLTVVDESSLGISLSRISVSDVVPGAGRRLVVLPQDLLENGECLSKLPNPLRVVPHCIQDDPQLVVGACRVLVVPPPNDPAQGQRTLQLFKRLLIFLHLAVGHPKLVVGRGGVGVLLAQDLLANL